MQKSNRNGNKSLLTVTHFLEELKVKIDAKKREMTRDREDDVADINCETLTKKCFNLMRLEFG